MCSPDGVRKRPSLNATKSLCWTMPLPVSYPRNKELYFMNKKILTAALLGGLAFAQAASAQEFDDRWYLTGSAGFNFQDGDRGTNDAPFVTLGLGKFISPNWSLDGELNYQNPNFDANQDQNWSQYGRPGLPEVGRRVPDHRWRPAGP